MDQIKMGLFHKSTGPKKANLLSRYKIYMTPSGKLGEDSEATIVELEEECEFTAVRSAEKQHAHLKVAKVERV